MVWLIGILLAESVHDLKPKLSTSRCRVYSSYRVLEVPLAVFRSLLQGEAFDPGGVAARRLSARSDPRGRNARVDPTITNVRQKLRNLGTSVLLER